MKTVVDQFAEALASAGVKRVYGMVDGSLAILADAIRRQRKIEWLHVQHEEIAAFAAGAEARLTGELAVCAGNCGPDNPHLINGLIDCHRSQAPVLAVSANIPAAQIGPDYFQETTLQTLFQKYCHYCEVISGAHQMSRVLEAALREAVSSRGVSVVVMPDDVALQPASDAPLPHPAGLLPPGPGLTPVRSNLNRPASPLNGWSRITILRGPGCAGAHDELSAHGEPGLSPGVANCAICASGRVFSFGPFRLFPSQRLLLEGNRRVQIGSRAFDILTILVERAGEVVNKEELIARTWPNVFVEDSNLKTSGQRPAPGPGRSRRRQVLHRYGARTGLQLRLAGQFFGRPEA